MGRQSMADPLSRDYSNIMSVQAIPTCTVYRFYDNTHFYNRLIYRLIYTFLLHLGGEWSYMRGIAGYSHMVVYCQCSTNNLAATVLTLFRKAVDLYGLLSRIRCDRGCENVDVSRYLLSHPLCGVRTSSVIAGRSIHNQRIECFWKDFFVGCICFLPLVLLPRRQSFT